eukprot:CAMPEP_0170169588 /NCGR_PEP_ID=MMETSP0040_2-20121228/2481_1 /TAXON_ID=641309 /ORGANISM="Lotharella oceanica, Strain CCMP622" /LENGTH=409 /DNA_ID=CAMNT_0010408395 /DNA_START=278 /DNA_END=1507 /DNA_ORIENTATION=-
MIAAKVALRPKASIDLPEDAKPSSSAITLAENYDDLLLDLEFEDVTMADLETLKRNVARHVDITQESKAPRNSQDETESDVEQARKADASVDIDFDINLGGEAEGLLDFDADQRPDNLDQSSLLNFEDPNDTTVQGDVELEFDLPPEVINEDGGNGFDEVKRDRPKKRKRKVAALDEDIEVSSKTMKARLADHRIPKRKGGIAERVRFPKRARSIKHLKSSPITIHLGNEISTALHSKIINKIKSAIKTFPREEPKGDEPGEVKPLSEIDEDELKHRHDGDQDADFLLEQSLYDISTIAAMDTSIELEKEAKQSLDEIPEDIDDSVVSSEVRAADRIGKMYHFVRKQMGRSKQTTFKKLIGRASRKAAAGVFHELLVLKTHGIVDVSQEEPYGTILMNKTERFEEGLSA